MTKMTTETRRCEWCGEIVMGGTVKCGCDAETEIERLRQWHREIVALACGWDEHGAIGPREPLSWESVARMAMDYAQAALSPTLRMRPAALSAAGPLDAVVGPRGQKE